MRLGSSVGGGKLPVEEVVQAAVVEAEDERHRRRRDAHTEQRAYVRVIVQRQPCVYARFPAEVAHRVRCQVDARGDLDRYRKPITVAVPISIQPPFLL